MTSTTCRPTRSARSSCRSRCPGVFAGTLLTFIPAAGDYINAELLGNVNTGMIGSQIEKLFIAESNYPAAAALSFIFMAIITAGVLLYAKVLGTEELQA